MIAGLIIVGLMMIILVQESRVERIKESLNRNEYAKLVAQQQLEREKMKAIEAAVAYQEEFNDSIFRDNSSGTIVAAKDLVYVGKVKL